MLIVFQPLFLDAEDLYNRPLTSLLPPSVRQQVNHLQICSFQQSVAIEEDVRVNLGHEREQCGQLFHLSAKQVAYTHTHTHTHTHMSHNTYTLERIRTQTQKHTHTRAHKHRHTLTDTFYQKQLWLHSRNRLLEKRNYFSNREVRSIFVRTLSSTNIREEISIYSVLDENEQLRPILEIVILQKVRF